MVKFPVLLCETVLRTRRSYHRCGTDITVDSMKRYYGNVLRNLGRETQATLRPHGSSCFSCILLCYRAPALLSIPLSLVCGRAAYFAKLQRPGVPRLHANALATAREVIPHFPAAESAFEISTPRLHFSRAVHRERAIISVPHENRRSRRK